MDSAFMELLACVLAERQVEVHRFEFEYMAQRRQGMSKRPPPRMPVLIQEFTELLEALQTNCGAPDLPIWVGGKSMGGRVASHLIADGQNAENIHGLMCFGYPFHPPKKPLELRTGHFALLQKPALIVQGVRDTFGCRSEVSGYALGEVKMHWLEYGDHDFKPPYRTGIAQEQLILEAAEVAAVFSSPSLSPAQGPAK